MPFQLPDLPYAYEALEPVIDSETMAPAPRQAPRGLHLQAQRRPRGHPVGETAPSRSILSNLSSLPRDIQTKVRNNGGGYYNHAHFWPIMQKPSTGGANKPEGELMAAIERDLGGFDKFKTEFSEAAANRFGSGWAWSDRQEQRRRPRGHVHAPTRTTPSCRA